MVMMIQAKHGALDHARIQIPGIGALERAHHVAGGVNRARNNNRPAAEDPDVISQHRERRQHHEHGEEAGTIR